MNQELIKQLSEITEVEKNMLEKGKWTDKEKILENTHLSVDYRRTLNEGKLIQLFPRLRFVPFSRHRRNYIQGVYMCEGQTTYFIDEKQITLKKGEILFLSPHAERKILAAKQDDLAVDFVILPEFFEFAFYVLGEEENLLRESLIRYLLSETPPDNYLYFQVADILPIQNLMENLVWVMLNPFLYKQAVIQSDMRLLFMFLTNYTKNLETKGYSFEQALNIEVLRYVDEYYQEGTLKELCEVLGFDVYWMSRMIKKLTGRNYKELLQIKRLNRAAYLLLHTQVPVAEISIEIGYDNTSYFHRIFREYFGVSPKEYRMENKK